MSGAQVAAFLSERHPVISNTARGVGSKRSSNERQDGSHVNKHLRNDPNTWNSDDTNHECQGAQEQQVESGRIPEDERDSIAPGLQDVITDELKSQVSNGLLATPEMVDQAVEQIFCAASLSARGCIRSVVPDAVEYIIFDQIETTVVGETIHEHIEKYFKGGKVAEEQKVAPQQCIPHSDSTIRPTEDYGCKLLPTHGRSIRIHPHDNRCQQKSSGGAEASFVCENSLSQYPKPLVTRATKGVSHLNLPLYSQSHVPDHEQQVDQAGLYIVNL